MKKLILMGLFIPCLSFGQKFEVAEQAGYILRMDGSITHLFTNQLSFGYHPLKHFSITSVYEYNALNEWVGILPKNNSVGITPDFTSKYFYAGIDLKIAIFQTISTFSPQPEETIITRPSFSYGLHAGFKQKIHKKLSLIEQIGYEKISLYQKNKFNTLLYQMSTSNLMLDMYYLRVGISYKL